MQDIIRNVAFNEDYTKLMHVWRVPGEIVDDDYFIVGTLNAKFTIENMMQYEITDKFRDIVKKLNLINIGE